MREALFSQDGWGCQHVNQDTNWEVPSSPEPANKDQSGPPIWKPNINNGTDLWESNLRNGGQPTAQQVPKPSWGHTPSSNLGGTWGEDDDGVDSTSVWSGQSGNITASGANIGINSSNVSVAVGASAGQQWGQSVVGAALGSTTNNTTTTAGPLPVATPGSGSSGNNVSTSGNVIGANAGAGNGWGDPREIRPLAGGGPMDIRSVDPRDSMSMRGASQSSTDPRDLRMIDPRDPIRGDPRGISGRLNGNSEMWGHHPPIAHNQIQNINKMIVSGVSTGGTSVVNSSIGPGSVVSNAIGAQWGTAQSAGGCTKDLSKQLTGWEEPSPPPQRRNIPNYDDGTSLWSQQTRGGNAHWKDMTDSISRNHLMRAQNQSGGAVGTGMSGNSNISVGGNPNNIPISGVAQNRLANSIAPSGVVSQHSKTDSSAMWGHPNNSVGGRNSTVNSWGDDTHNVTGGTVSGSNWGDDKPNIGIQQIGANTSSWNDSSSAGVTGWGKQNKLSSTNVVSSGWSNVSTSASNVESGDLASEWPHGGIVSKNQQQQQKLANINVGGINSEMVKQSKQYRILVDTGFKKEDVERALLSANMNIEEAAEILRANVNSSMALEGWRRHEESIGPYSELSNSANSGFPPRYPLGGTQSSISFPPNNLINNLGSGTAVTNSNTSNLAAMQVQKYLAQGPHTSTVSGGPQSVAASTSIAFGQSSSNATSGVNIASNTANQPSGQHIRMLGQQIQLAIHSGFISSQILTQPLTQTTLNLLNQLLSNIKHLQAAQQSLTRGNNSNPMAVNVAIAKYKQQIQTLQTQINAQQAVYLKQQNLQQNSQHPSGHLNNSGTEYLRTHDSIANLQGNFTELNLAKSSGYQGASNQQSRLNQWKLPVLDKDSVATDNADFSRAPGATKQNLSSNSNNIGSLGLQNDGTWSTGRNIGDGWPDPNETENKDWTVVSTAAAYTDLVQEFEPGKPWKGSQIKTIEDDPSITPGSVARSPLSINSTPKDADIFSNTGKNSPNELPPLSLSSSTWSFNPAQNFPSWSDNSQQCVTTELWSSSLHKAPSRGPPPGLSTHKSSSIATTTTPSTVSGSSNGWLANRNVPSSSSTWTGANVSWNSSWLMLKNLNAQIDGTTLRTLCMQHGPLVSFHLYLSQGIALCKYATREEANKAQMALNNCVLGNTTIFAESPSENEVQNLLQHFPQAPSLPNSAISSNTSSGNSGNSSSLVPGSGIGTNNASNSISGSNISGNANNGSISAGLNCGAVNVMSSSSGNSSGTGSVVTVGSNLGNISNNGGGITANSGSSSGIINSTNVSKSGSPGSNINITGAQPNVSTNTSSNNTTWRQTQSQTLQGQTRASGREADYDYISQFVCSIVDD